MSDTKGFPQIPARAWWGVRELIAKSPTTKLDDNMLSVTLGVQPAAARQYLAELKRIELIDDQGVATDLGKNWRLDDNYEDVVNEILATAYPEGLVSIAPPGEAQRDNVERWFMNAGLGSGTAKNKAGTYMMIANDRPGEVKVRAAPKAAEKGDVKARDSNRPRKSREDKPKRRAGSDAGRGVMPLNVNVQIHISADASTDQIETIFAAMRKYLHDEAA